MASSPRAFGAAGINAELFDAASTVQTQGVNNGASLKRQDLNDVAIRSA